MKYTETNWPLLLTDTSATVRAQKRGRREAKQNVWFSKAAVQEISEFSLQYFVKVWGTSACTSWCSWLRQCADSITERVIGICHWLNPSDCPMALGSTQLLTSMSTRSISSGVRGQRRSVSRAENLCKFICRVTRNSWSLKLLGPSEVVEGLFYRLWGTLNFLWICVLYPNDFCTIRNYFVSKLIHYSQENMG